MAVINTPPELLELTFRYMRVLWLGLLATAILNIFTSALRAMRDSRTPFLSLVVSTVLNIILDFVLIAWMDMGVEGAALATVLSQTVAALWCLAGIRRTRMLPARVHWRPQAAVVRELLRLGVPLLLSHGVTATGELAVLTAINRFGVLFVTGTTASRRYFSLFNIAGNALEGSLATFVGQNWGAREKQRIRRGARTAFRMGIGFAIVITLLMIAFAQPLILLFLPDGAGESLQVGIDSLRVEVLFLIALYMLLMHRAAIQGMGNAVVPMLSGFLELVMRILSAWLLPIWVGREGLYFVDAVTWTVTAAMLITFYHVSARKKLKE
jgi:putative MATE family efflux protein